MRLLAALGVLVLVAVLGAAAYAWLGFYNIAASDPHADAVAWSLDTTMVRSVERRAETEVGAVPALAEPERIRTGAEHYLGEGCVTCHGAPGFERAGYAERMRPRPPMLAGEAGEWTDRQLFWIIEHGIKMSGMPRFGATHGDGEIWSLVAFVRRLPDLSATEIEDLVPASDGHHADEAVEAGPEEGAPADTGEEP